MRVDGVEGVEQRVARPQRRRRLGVKVALEVVQERLELRVARRHGHEAGRDGVQDRAGQVHAQKVPRAVAVARDARVVPRVLVHGPLPRGVAARPLRVRVRRFVVLVLVVLVALGHGGLGRGVLRARARAVKSHRRPRGHGRAEGVLDVVAAPDEPVERREDGGPGHEGEVVALAEEPRVGHQALRRPPRPRPRRRVDARVEGRADRVEDQRRRVGPVLVQAREAVRRQGHRVGLGPDHLQRVLGDERARLPLPPGQPPQLADDDVDARLAALAALPRGAREAVEEEPAHVAVELGPRLRRPGLSLRRAARVVRVVDEGRVARVERLRALQLHDGVEALRGALRRRRRPQQEAARDLEEAARDVDGVVREVLEAGPEAREGRVGRRDAELDELADEARVPDLRLQVVLRLLALEPAELAEELGHQKRPDVLVGAADHGGDARVLGHELRRRPRHREERARQAPPRVLRAVALAERARQRVRALAVVARRQILGQ